MGTRTTFSPSTRARPPAGPSCSIGAALSSQPSQQATTQLFPRPGWVNQDAAEIWTTTLPTAREARSARPVDPAPTSPASGSSISAKHSSSGIESTGEPAAPAIVWQSRQSQPSGRRAPRPRHGAGLPAARTGLVPDAYFTASKLAWLLDEEPELRHRAEAGELLAGTVDSWLLWNLTGGAVHATDVSNASRTMLFDINTLVWSPELLAGPGHPRSDAAPRRVQRRRSAGFTVPHLLRRGDPDHRHRRRSAGRPLRPDLLRPGRGQEHVSGQAHFC